MARYRVGLETRRRILDATRALLGEVGLEGTTLKAICDRAGVGAGSFYNLFPTKEACVLTVVGEAIDAVGPVADVTGTERVADLVAAYVAFVTHEPLLARIYLQAAVAWGLADAQIAARFRRHQERRAERLAAAFAREHPGIDSGEAAARGEALLATLNGLALHWLLDPSLDLRAHADRLARELTVTR